MLHWRFHELFEFWWILNNNSLFFSFQISKSGSGPLSRQDSGGSLTKGPRKTSTTSLSQASADTGIIGDIDNKVSSIV